ncbi:MAG: prepilin-type N-terminal cleavage/methylation domain-containing protein [Phycisphaerales bacterium]|nr:prepilin-type N-terminal cleavage/methylation domain-containing protein [Phycisphaerales bacterium]
MKSRGFSLVELVSVLAVVASVGAVLGPSVGQMRGQMRGLSSEGNLATIGQASGMYALDNEGRIFTFTWKGGETYTNLRNGKSFVPQSDGDAASYQVRDILYRGTGRVDGATRISAPLSRLMHRRFSHLVLSDYMNGDPSSHIWADPSDGSLLGWQSNPLEFLTEDNTIPYGDGFPSDGYDLDSDWADFSIRQLWAFSSSYQVVPRAWLFDDRATYVPFEDTPHLYRRVMNDNLFSQRYFSEVVHPSGKVLMHEEFDRDHGPEAFFAYDHAQPAKLMFDGSINTMASGFSRSAVSPLTTPFFQKEYFHLQEWRQVYIPLDRFPLPLSGLFEDEELNMRYRWTAGGLRGTDYNPLLSGSR